MPELDAEESAMLAGEAGPAAAMAMRIVVGLARALDAPRLVQVASAHIDSCLYHGRAGVDFARRLADLGGQVRVPTTLNVGSLDLLHPGTVRERSDAEGTVAAGGRALADAYAALGARPTWTCAPYQLDARPGRGEHVAWAESNAIAFCNSVLGARTGRYGDFVDISAAVTGRAPYAGLHTDQARLATVVVDCSAIPDRVAGLDVTAGLLGHLVGSRVGSAVPLLVGIPALAEEDLLKAFGAAAASSGSVGMYHVEGVTPEAPTRAAALGGREPVRRLALITDDLRAARRTLRTARTDRLDAVSVGTPHASPAELRTLADLLRDGPRIAESVAFYVSTNRSALAAAPDTVDALRAAGVRVVVDTCTYITAILDPGARTVMTNSVKWGHYAPANLGVDVMVASLAECVLSAQEGRIVVDDRLLG